MWILKSENKIIAILGLKYIDIGSYEILHIAVLPEFRGLGLGNKIIESIIKKKDIEKLIAETDDDAVLFYKKCGFEIRLLESDYKQSKRYLCEKIITKGENTK